ncbi:phosphoribosyl transferase [Streptomyces hygroscopicus]|uniref:phosphoribosyltransferase family protein n=1 Tax=Streptomyces hygroscopicus TaxID=1912 RepID=UPI0022408CFC|nr:phosphoribosyltransferase family protein [Streptomyces hygroscopicus]MCW7943083.1 phosphoribosyl transferase [Streptomyces hygroscopicus]
MVFVDRLEAGRQLGARLRHLRGEDVVVLGLPRGGVPVAAEVADALDAPLDVCLVRKLGVPFQPELAMGALGEDGVRVINDQVVQGARVTEGEIAQVEEREREVLERGGRRYRGARAPVAVEGRTVVVVDDGVATGSTARAACRIARARGAARIVLAVPVAPWDWTERLGGEADDLVCLDTPRDFFAVGQFYADFSEVDDEEVADCLRRTAGRSPGSGSGAGGQEEVEVVAGAVRLEGGLTVPESATGIVIFAHGSGSSRHSPRDRFVAEGLNRAGLGTLLFDLLTEEERDRAEVFETGLLAGRLTDATRWLRRQPAAEGLPIGYFGADGGAAAVLWAAAEPEARIAAVVSRGGRPDLAGPRLPAVTAPTLLVVGSADPGVRDLNRQAQAQLRSENRLAIVPGATHLFEEPGALEAVTDLARHWFTDHMAPAHV